MNFYLQRLKKCSIYFKSTLLKPNPVKLSRSDIVDIIPNTKVIKFKITYIYILHPSYIYHDFQVIFYQINHRKRHSKISRYKDYKSSLVDNRHKPPVLETILSGQIKSIFTELI